jgi:17beta-estradiol 17-dehydrogenase / very-long-chain 3-oxoacyl-CoA reductase
MFPFKDDRYNTFFQYFGLLVLTYTLAKNGYKALNNFLTFFLGFGAVNFKKYGSWAVITGCTDGIGKSYTELLAKKGLNIVLISRTLQKLEDQSNELKQKYNVQTKVIAADFTGYFK